MNALIDNDVKKNIRKLYEDNQLAKSFLDWCADKQRDAKETKIERMIAILSAPRSEVVSLAKALNTAGCGEFVVGRRGAPSRFVWKHSRIDLGRIASGETDEFEGWVHPLDEDEDSPQQELEYKATEQGLTIKQAKSQLALALGLEPAQIEISIRA